MVLLTFFGFDAVMRTAQGSFPKADLAVCLPVSLRLPVRWRGSRNE